MAVGQNRLRAIQATAFITPKPAAQACEVSFLPRIILASRQWYGKERPGGEHGRRCPRARRSHPLAGHVTPGRSSGRPVKSRSSGRWPAFFGSGPARDRGHSFQPAGVERCFRGQLGARHSRRDGRRTDLQTNEIRRNYSGSGELGVRVTSTPASSGLPVCGCKRIFSVSPISIPGNVYWLGWLAGRPTPRWTDCSTRRPWR